MSSFAGRLEEESWHELLKAVFALYGIGSEFVSSRFSLNRRQSYHMASSSTSYVMGHDEREHRRLALQACVLNPFTEQLLRRAGISAGMRILDVGCGVGEVAIIAAHLAGRDGEVIAIDIDGAALSTARAKSLEQKLGNIRFVNSDVASYRAEKLFDAVIGRHVLIHATDPQTVMKTAFSILNPGGVAIFQEFDFSVFHPAFPDSPLMNQVYAVFRNFCCKAIHGNVGTQLFHLFIESGFVFPDCRVEYPIGGGADSPFYEWISESFRSILPHAKALGMVPDSIGDIATLAQRLREEAVSLRSGFPSPLMVGGFATKPQTQRTDHTPRTGT